MEAITVRYEKTEAYSQISAQTAEHKAVSTQYVCAASPLFRRSSEI